VREPETREVLLRDGVTLPEQAPSPQLLRYLVDDVAGCAVCLNLDQEAVPGSRLLYFESILDELNGYFFDLESGKPQFFEDLELERRRYLGQLE
jgi:hypothetical protein